MEGHVTQFTPPDARQFSIAVRKIADSLTYGTDRSPYLGSGVEYVQSREYQYGDPIRAIDWRVTARVGRPFIKEFETPRRLPCYLLVDTSASMMISSGQRTKYETALHVAGGLAFACLDRVSPVGVLTVGERDFHMRPSLSRDRILQWLLQLSRFQYNEHTALRERLRRLQPELHNRTLLIVLSDLHEPDALPLLRRLSQQHEVIAIQIVDRAETGLSSSAVIRGVEAETGQTFTASLRNLRTIQESIETDLRRGGIDHLVLHPDGPIISPLREFFRSRNVFNRGAR